MKTTITAASLLSLAAAQTIPIPILPDLGECVYQGCLINGFAQVDCALTDNECYCRNFPSIAGDVEPCLRELECQQSDINSECSPGYVWL
jgi:metal-sulfur cluster biosynthetic enzyme